MMLIQGGGSGSFKVHLYHLVHKYHLPGYVIQGRHETCLIQGENVEETEAQHLLGEEDFILCHFLFVNTE